MHVRGVGGSLCARMRRSDIWPALLLPPRAHPQLFGRSVPQPRLVAYMADHGDLSYTYSGLTLAPEPWLPALAALRDELAALTGARFNRCFARKLPLRLGVCACRLQSIVCLTCCLTLCVSRALTRSHSCLLNQYRSGDDSLGWHADDEPVYGPAPTIASVSLGACRDFCLRHARQRSHKLSVALGGGDVLVMAGSTQQHWQHCVPRRKRVPGPRVSLTFRLIVAPQAAAG